MIALYIVLAVLFIVALILFSNVTIYVSIDGDYSLSWRFWFFKFKNKGGLKSQIKLKLDKNKTQKRMIMSKILNTLSI